MTTFWEVAGLTDVGGVFVRVGRSTASTQLPQLLAAGAVVEEREFVEGQLRFWKLTGEGPLTGWVDVSPQGRELLVRRAALAEHAGEAAEAPVQRPEQGLAAYRRLLNPTPVTLAQWYDHRQGAGSPCATTSIKWTEDGHAWHEIQEARLIPEQRRRALEWDLPLMDVLSGVETQIVGEEGVAATAEARPVAGTADVSGCRKCPGCARPPGHEGSCMDTEARELTPMPKRPRPGVYAGMGKNVRFAGDDVSYEVTLLYNGTCTLECVPKLSLYAGGQPPWCCGGSWAFDGWVVDVHVTREDFRGPKGEDKIQMPVTLAGSALVFKDTHVMEPDSR